MIYNNENAALLATGLPLEEIASLLRERLSGEALQDKLNSMGNKYLKRYLIIKEYKDLVISGKQKLPIIIVLTGMPGVGKTSLSREIATMLGVGPVLGGDAIRSACRGLLPRKRNKPFFTSVYQSWQFFGKYTEKNAIRGYRAQAKILNDTMQRIIVDRGLRDGESMIIEFLHFIPDQFSQEVFNHPSFIPFVLKINDADIYTQRLQARERYTHLRSSGDRLIQQQGKYLLLQSYQCSCAEKAGIPIIVMDDFEKGFEDMLNHLFPRIKKLNQLLDYSNNLSIIQRLTKEREDV
ncbi:hypothetical protein EU523_01535 [Candidatus Heimdallarchaeota archaeon]|nr:MAG: hypothetical protein EU523_01535 [Candidatus Heimdallarchaeota archaeon]